MSDSLYMGKRMVRAFERLRLERGLPDVLRTRNGPEFLRGEFIARAESVDMKIH